MARVLLATLRGAGGFEKKLVVKQIRDELAFDQQFIRRFVEEAKTTVALSHPNIVPVYELGVEQGTYFLAMELVEGVSVAELLRATNEDGSRQVLTPEEGAYVGVEVCRALDYAHRRMKVVHRDITPRNVMIDEEGQIKLIDFGIAAPALVSGHEILGSPGHMAPEQVDGGELGPPTDIFAVAVLLMEAWTGAAPFRRATPEECAVAVREPHPKPSDFDPRLLPLDAAISRAMDVDARKRQQEASELARELRSFLQEIDVADLARALGDRVRALREAADSSAPSRLTVPHATAASQGELDTKTFAAREEALSWSSVPPPKAAADALALPSTRQLPSSDARIPAAGADRGRNKEDPAMGIPTPLMVEVESLDKIRAEMDEARNRVEAQSEGPWKSSKPVTSTAALKQSEIPTVRRPKVPRPVTPRVDAVENLDTIATRPLETNVGSPDRQSGRVATSWRGRSLAFFGGVSVVALVGFAGWHMRGVGPKDLARPTLPSATPSSITPTPPPPPPTASDTTALTTASPADSGKIAPAASIPPTPAPSGAPTPSASTTVAAGKASVSLLGEPGTRVWVDGVSRGGCPARLTLDQGAHEVRFTFEPTGESLVERFTAKSGDHMTVRAQFTGATPTVKVQR